MSEYIGEIVILTIALIVYLIIKYIYYKISKDDLTKSKRKKDLINGFLSILTFLLICILTVLLLKGLSGIMNNYLNEVGELNVLTIEQRVHGVILSIAFFGISIGFIYSVYKFVFRAYIIKFIKYTDTEKELQKRLDIEWHNKLSKMPIFKYIIKERKL